MKYIKLFEKSKYMDSRPFREVDIAKIWNFVSDIDFMRVYYYEYEDQWEPPNRFFQLMLQSMLDDKEIEFHRVVNPLDDEISYAFGGRVKSVSVKDDVVVDLYGNDPKYILGRIYAGKMKKEEIIKIYNSKITETEQKIEDMEMRLDAKKYNL